MGKVAIVGVEGSGKTVLMAGLCECFKQNPDSDDPYLMPENQAAFKFMETVPYMLRVKHQWPAATGIDNLRAMRWSYRFGNEVIETVELLDYPGELYRLAFGDAEEVNKAELEANRNEVNKFLEHLTDADTLLVLLNLSDVVNLGGNHRNLETVWITRGILAYAKRLPNIKHTVLVFTQADRYAAELKSAGGPEGLYAKKLPMLKTLFPKQQVMAVAAVSGTDEKGNPGERYSSEGCHTIMQCILAEKNISFHEYLTKCETSRGMIVSFNSGNPTEFLKLIELFLSEVKDLVQAGKPFNKLYKAQINIHQRDASVFRELAPDLNNLIKNTNLETLAIPVTWGGLEERYTYVRSAIDSIKKHFNVEHLNQLTKKIEVEKATKRATKFIFIVLGIFVLMCAALFKSTYDAEQARLRRIEQDHLESDRKKQTERIEAEKLHVKHLEDVKRLKESALDALVKARQANEIELWQSCLAQVDKVLAIDSGNIEASAIKAEAYKYLMPTLTIEVESGGDKIGAIVTEGEKTWVAPCTISLSQNMRYYFRVSATEPTKWIRYKDESLYVTADWCGPKIRCISLEAVNRPVEGKNWRSPSTGIEFVWISSLKMWVGKYEVTNGEYRRMKPGHDSKSYSQNTLNMDSQPVVFVTSDDAKAYADWLTNVENEVLKKMRYRLPTSSEFISYAKCGDNRRYPWGNSGPPKFGNYFDITGAGLSHSPNMFDPHAMNNYDDGYMVSAPVRFSGENEWGLFGVGGNVRECTSSAPPWMGGSWCCSSVYSLECTATLYMDGSRCFYDSGFRLVLSPETE